MAMVFIRLLDFCCIKRISKVANVVSVMLVKSIANYYRPITINRLYARRNPPILTFTFNERVTINERTSLNQRTNLQLINDVRAMNEKLLESANELRTINKPLLQ